MIYFLIGLFVGCIVGIAANASETLDDEEAEQALKERENNA